MSARSTNLFLLLILLMSSTSAYSAGVDDADERLFRAQLAMAEQGNTRAQYYLGEMHEHGLGTRQNADEAFKWYAKAAEQGDSLAKRKLTLRNEIINEIRKEQEAEKLIAPKAAAKPAKPETASKNTGPSRQAMAAQVDEDRQEQQDKIRAEEKAKRRAAVRAMMLDRIRNPVGEMFE